MWHTIWKGIWSHKRRLLGTSTAVLLGVAFLASALVLGDTMTKGFDGLFSEANAGTDVVVRNATEIGSGDVSMRGRLDASLENELEQVDDVGDIAPVVEGYGQIVGADGDNIGGGGPPTVATNWLGETPINPWRLDQGRPPRAGPAGQPYEVVIDRAAAEDGGLRVGDVTTVKVPEPVDVKIVGLVTFGGADSLGPTTYTGFASDVANSLIGEPGEVSAFRIAAQDGTSDDALRDEIARVLPDQAEALTGAQLTQEMMDDIQSEFLGMFKTMLLVFALIALVVASFSIHNTFSILIAQRTRESALLRAIGASRRQVLSSVIVEAILVGVVASGLGLVAGYGLASGLKSILEGAGMDLNVDGVVMGTGTIVGAVVVGVVVTLLASVAPAIRASRVAPLAALREAAVDSTGSSKKRAIFGAVVSALGIGVVLTSTASEDSAMSQAGIGALITLIGAVILGPVVARPAAALLGSGPAMFRGQTGRLARRNAMRNPRRTAGSASALMVGTAVVVLFATFGASIKASIEDTVDKNFGGDLIILSDDFSGAGISPRVAADVAELPEVTTAVGMSIGVATINGTDTDPSVIDPARLNAVLDVDVTQGSLDDVTPGEMAISETYAGEHDLQLGSPIPVSFADGASTELTVGAIFDSTDTVGDLVMTPEDWTPHAEQPGDIVVLIDLAEGVTEAEGKAAVTAVAERHAAPDVQTRDEYIDTVGSEVDAMLYFVYGMLGLSVLIALMGIANTLSLSIHERTRELGLLRAVGQTRSQVRSTVRWESVIVAVFGTLGGVGLGTFLGWGLMRALAAQEDFGVFAAPTGTLVVVLVLAAVAGVLAAWRPSRRAARLDILGAIATD
jgi:putative ABC transport system permease protein